MKNNLISVLLLISDDHLIQASIKEVIQKNAKGVLFITANNLDSFVEKLNWFSTTFILVVEEAKDAQKAIELTKEIANTDKTVVTFSKNTIITDLPVILQEKFTANKSIRDRREKHRLDIIHLKKQFTSDQQSDRNIPRAE